MASLESMARKLDIDSGPLPMMPARVTVAVPSLNSGAYLHSALDSIASQCVTIQICVADGGSTDASAQIIDEYRGLLHWYRSAPDKGQSQAINEAVANGSGDYVCWLNADDELAPGALALMVEYLDKHPQVPAVYGQARYVDEEGQTIGSYETRPFSRENLSLWCIICQPATLVRRDVWESVGGVDEQLHLAMDYDLWWRILENHGEPAYLEEILALSRVHPQTKTANNRRQHYREAMAIVRRYNGRLPLVWYLKWPFSVLLFPFFSPYASTLGRVVSEHVRRGWPDVSTAVRNYARLAYHTCRSWFHRLPFLGALRNLPYQLRDRAILWSHRCRDALIHGLRWGWTFIPRALAAVKGITLHLADNMRNYSILYAHKFRDQLCHCWMFVLGYSMHVWHNARNQMLMFVHSAAQLFQRARHWRWQRPSVNPGSMREGLQRKVTPGKRFKWPRPRLGNFYQHDPRPLESFYNIPAPPAGSTRDLQVSLVTPSYMQGGYIGRTLASVLDQAYPALEYVVQDGGSTDETVAVLEANADQLSFWESTPDGGQTPAINLGFARTSGDVMAYLNSDDLLMPGTLQFVTDYFTAHPEVDVVYGNRLIIDEHDQVVGEWILPGHDASVLPFADYVPQETLFWRRSAWESIGGSLDESFSFAMDWDLLLRLRRSGARFAHLPYFLGAFRVHEEQKTSAMINELGFAEMNRLRERELGYVPKYNQINRKLISFMARHVAVDIQYRRRAGLHD